MQHIQNRLIIILEKNIPNPPIARHGYQHLDMRRDPDARYPNRITPVVIPCITRSIS
ncbi:MAG: hypothetical protein VX294_05345 [Candidatus Latescibacterota bacterium]|nr:hypothetical protein [Candidatus Latescibacterota bacterium]